MSVTLTDKEARELRAAAARILELVPDPDAPMHACGGEIVDRATLCGRGGHRPRTTTLPHEVTCKACRHSSEWDAWYFQHGPGF